MLKYIASLALVLAVLWLLFSGLWTHPVLLPLGAVSVAFTIWVCHRLGILDRAVRPLHTPVAALRYWPWLLARIIESNLHVARRILAPRLEISPRIVRVPITQQTDLGRAVLANSITLTPGTVSIHVRSNEIWFYALDEESAQGVLSGEMDRRVRRFEDVSR